MSNEITITVLMENTSSQPQLQCAHGLSFWIVWLDLHILFDTGPGPGFLKNAAWLNIPIETADLLVISHGHDDHGGGLATFLRCNRTAPVYIRQSAFDPHFAKSGGNYKEIGLMRGLADSPQIVYTSNCQTIKPGLVLFSLPFIEPEQNKPINLFCKEQETYVPDAFTHEQNLLISKDEGDLLVTGCAHNGILNIIQHAQNLTGRWPKWVVGGFHLPYEELEAARRQEAVFHLANKMLALPTVYYTGHCTYLPVQRQLKEKMGERVHFFSTGKQIRI